MIDQPTETTAADPDSAVAAWREQIAPLADSIYVVEQLLGQVEAPLGALYQQAEEAGDQVTIDRVMMVWEKSQAIAAQIPPFVAALSGGAATIEELRQQRDAVLRELNSLAKAITDGDMSDPRLEQFAEYVEQGVYEYIEWTGEMVSSDELYDHIYDEIAATFGVSAQAAASFLAAACGDADELDDTRRAQFAALLQSFEEGS